MDYSDEEWKDIPSYGGRYQASTLGRIKSVGHPRRIHHTFIMKPQPRGASGYLGICLYSPGETKGKYFFIHCVVAATFLGAVPRGMQVNHINFNKHDNRVANLEYVTPRNNTGHALRNGRKKTDGKGRVLTPDEVREIRDRVAEYTRAGLSARQIAKRYNTSHTTILDIRSGKRWKCLDA